tara:strand:+ start:251 stop:691 length:441 start_codon:yes stop_codon:yes gene_type:complete
MAKLDYMAVQNKIKVLLDADSRTDDYNVFVEESFMLKPDQCPYVGIFLDSYDTLEDTETIGGNRPYLTQLNIEIWIYGFSFENNDGAGIRDGILGNVKEVMKENKTLDGTILYFQFGSGEFDNQKNTAGLGFFKGVSLTLECQLKE